VDHTVGLDDVKKRKLLPPPGFQLRPLRRAARSHSLCGVPVGSRISFSPRRPDRLLGSPSLLSNGVKRLEHEAVHWLPTSAEVKKMWIYTSTSPSAFTVYCLISWSQRQLYLYFFTFTYLRKSTLHHITNTNMLTMFSEILAPCCDNHTKSIHTATCCLNNVTVICGFRFDTSFYLTFNLAELQLFTLQIYNTETSDLSSGS
jgi:hypothetical protein